MSARSCVDSAPIAPFFTSARHNCLRRDVPVARIRPAEDLIHRGIRLICFPQRPRLPGATVPPQPGTLTFHSITSPLQTLTQRPSTPTVADSSRGPGRLHRKRKHQRIQSDRAQYCALPGHIRTADHIKRDALSSVRHRLLRSRNLSRDITNGWPIFCRASKHAPPSVNSGNVCLDFRNRRPQVHSKLRTHPTPAAIV